MARRVLVLLLAVLAGRLILDAPAPSRTGRRLVSGPPLERSRLRPVLATGPPLWKTA